MKRSPVLISVIVGVLTLLACTLSASASPSVPTAPVELQLEAWAGETLRFRCPFTSGSNCGTHTIQRGSTENLRYQVAGTDHNIECLSSPWNFGWWPGDSHNYTAQDPPITWEVDCWGDVGGATKQVTLVATDPIPPPPPPPPPPSQSLTDVYGDNGEPIEYQWQGGSGGTAWTVHRYANRYVVWTAGRGTYVIGRSVTGTFIPGYYPNHYMGPGYIGQFSPREGPANKLLVNDPLRSGTLGPRDGLHGGLGCFAVDLYRVGTGGVDLNCRLLSSNGSPGVYQVVNETIFGDSGGVTIAMTTRYRDSTGAVFSVTYDHWFTPANVTTQYIWESDTANPDVYVKEPRIVGVFGTSDVPIYAGEGQYRDQPPNCYPPRPDGTHGFGEGVWGLEPDLVRRDDGDHHWDMNDAVPWCATVQVGPGAIDPDRQYHRGGFSFKVGGVHRPLSVEDAGYNHDYDGYPQFPDTPLNFNGWRRNAVGAPGIPGYAGTCKTKDPREVCRMQICETCAANAWELGRVPGQYGVSAAMEAWRASISLDDYWGRARRIPAAGQTYAQTFKF